MEVEHEPFVFKLWILEDRKPPVWYMKMFKNGEIFRVEDHIILDKPLVSGIPDPDDVTDIEDRCKQLYEAFKPAA